jgi:hypothetical protein
MGNLNNPDARFYVQQVDVILNQAAPGTGVIYALLPLTTFVRLISVAAVTTWTVQPTPLQIHSQVDGIGIDGDRANPVSAAYYLAIWDPPGANYFMATYGTIDEYEFGRGFMLECKTLELSAEVTGGTVSNLSSRAKYQRYV